MTPLGEHLRQLRAERGVLQRDMAKALGVTPSYLSALERGKRGTPTWDMLQRIIGFFGVIWDEAEEIERLAALSHPRVTIDTVQLSSNATLLANRLAERIDELSEDEIDQLLKRLG